MKSPGIKQPGHTTTHVVLLVLQTIGTMLQAASGQPTASHGPHAALMASVNALLAAAHMAAQHVQRWQQDAAAAPAAPASGTAPAGGGMQAAAAAAASAGGASVGGGAVASPGDPGAQAVESMWAQLLGGRRAVSVHLPLHRASGVLQATALISKSMCGALW